MTRFPFWMNIGPGFLQFSADCMFFKEILSPILNCFSCYSTVKLIMENPGICMIWPIHWCNVLHVITASKLGTSGVISFFCHWFGFSTHNDSNLRCFKVYPKGSPWLRNLQNGRDYRCSLDCFVRFYVYLQIHFPSDGQIDQVHWRHWWTLSLLLNSVLRYGNWSVLSRIWLQTFILAVAGWYCMSGCAGPIFSWFS